MTPLGNSNRGQPKGQTQSEIHKIPQPIVVHQVRGRVMSLACAPDGVSAAIAKEDSKTISLVNLGTGPEEKVLAGTLSQPSEVVFSPSGEFLAVGCMGGVEIWNMESKSLSHTVIHEGSINRRIVFSPSGQYLFVTAAAPDAVIRQIDVKTWQAQVLFRAVDNKLLPDTFGQDIHAMAISPNGATLAIRLSAGTVLLDVASKNVICTISDSKGGSARLGFLNELLLAVAKTNVEIWDVKTGYKRSEYLSGPVTALQYLPEHGLLVTAGEGDISRPGRVNVWDVTNGNQLASFPCHQDVVLALSFVPGSPRIVTGSVDGTIAVWDLSRIARERKGVRDQ